LRAASARTPLAATRRIVATGHQAWLWHPGILAKYLAAAHAARVLDATPLAVVVDHDVHDALRLELPMRQGDRLTVLRIDLAPSRADIPSGAQPPVDPALVLTTLRGLTAATQPELVNLQPLLDAWTDLPASSSLADQVALVLGRLMRPYLGDMALVHASDLMDLGPARELIARMLADIGPCLRAYNQAAAEFPHAGIEPLPLGPDRGELPLWYWTPGSPRQKVHAHLATSGATLAAGAGQGIDPRHLRPDEHLAPRALLLTALMRSAFCDLFIHGLGGAVYDRVTERWWQLWTGGELAPKTVVSADVFLPLDVPINTPEQWHRAQWWAHHLPHNIDRVAADLGAPERSWAQRKRELLTHMADDRDRPRRAGAFAQLHELNGRLAQARPGLLDAARRDLDRTRAGLANRALAARRDWCFALYPPAQLMELAAAIRAAHGSASRG
jgi:hypothetical protein